MQENECKSHHVIVSHLSPPQVLPTHLNVNANKWDDVNGVSGISVEGCK